MASLVETCKLNGVEPQQYFTDVLTRLVNGWPQSRIDELMPWRWAKSDHAWTSSAGKEGAKSSLTIGETLARLDAMTEAAPVAAAKVAARLRGLETYVSGQGAMPGTG